MSKVSLITWEKLACKKPDSIGSSRIRGRWLLSNWNELSEWEIGTGIDTEVMIFQKAYWQEMILGDVKNGFSGFNGIKIFDICDPDWLERDDAMKYYSACDAVVTSTEALAEYLRKLLPNTVVKCIPDRIDFNSHQVVKTEHSDDLKVLGWFGYSHNYKYLTPVFKTLAKKGMKLYVHSDTGIESSDSGFELVWKKYYYPTLHDSLIKYDALVFPAERSNVDQKGKFKSNNKLLTAYALKIPVIEVPDDLERLKTKEARMQEVEDKYKFVKENYDVKRSVDEYKELIKLLKEKRGDKID